MSDSERNEPEGVRWIWVTACTLLGIAVLTVAVKGESWWQWQGAWPSIAVNLGTTLLLAAILFFLEQRFTGRVVRASERAVGQAAADVEEHLQRRTDELSTRIDDLQSQVNERMDTRAQMQDRAVANLETDIRDSYRGTCHGQPLGCAQRWCRNSPGQQRSSGHRTGLLVGHVHRPERHQPGLRLEVEARPRLTATRRLSLIKLEWRPDETVASFAER